MGNESAECANDTEGKIVAARTNGIPSALQDELDAMVCSMQTPQHAKGIDALFNASPEDLGAAATGARLNASRNQPDKDEYTARIVRVLVFATKVLGSREVAMRWMTRPHKALNGKMPTESSLDPAAVEMALKLLSTIDRK